ncbi:MAG: [protein-PII] uridylyltransferase [Nocardioides sp.]|uniref:[protein-PII] uridylyltransferase n=1 Tax=Nocardioides sp. TaxID=35761 RepID=UPI0039E6DA2C
MTASGRARRTAEADAWCSGAYAAAAAPTEGVALVAVGGFGRGELAPYSDLDVVLVHDADAMVDPWVERLWYPLWDSGSRLDHAVRSLPEMVDAAAADPRVATGLLDLRHLAGDSNLTLRLRSVMLAEWRREARDRLPALHKLVISRHDLVGELAHSSVPDLKEAQGGLRDATVLRALVASWLVDVPHVELERSRRALLDVRDVLHHATGRPTDRIAPELWEEIARGCDLPDARAAQAHVREHGRRLTHLSRLAWRRLDAVLARPTSSRGPRVPRLAPIGSGLALAAGEVVLDARTRPSSDPTLLLRAAAEAAERDLVLAPATAARLVREGARLPEPWPREARQQLTRLLAAGRGLLGVWETLEETGALDLILPEWERIRLLPHASAIHRFTVDRHVVETCVEASTLIRRAARPDVLMVGALLHDIGKGGLTEHSVAGEPIARAVAARMGFASDEVDLIGALVRWHLLLAQVATTRDPDDPATAADVISRAGSADAISLLALLTEADARATAPAAWTSWRAELVRQLVQRCLASLADRPAATDVRQMAIAVPDEVRLDRDAVAMTLDQTVDGARLTVLARDRVGLLADIAACLALQRASVRAARAWDQGEYGVSVWEVADELLDPAVLRQRFAAVVAGRVDPRDRLRRPSGSALGPSVAIRPEASEQSTVLEVRAADRPGLLYLALAALAQQGITVRSAHVDTLGPQAVDVFYVQEADAGVLSESRAAQVAHAVRSALEH